MKYKLITIIVILTLIFLWITRNVNAAVQENTTPPSDYMKITGENISDGSENKTHCVTYFYGNAIGRNLMPMQKITCQEVK